jgi:hypothetical protein
VRRRIWTVVIGLLIIVDAVGMIHIVWGRTPPQDHVRTGPAAQGSGRALRDSVRVPDLRGMTALKAHAQLLDLQLKLGRVRPTRGPAGFVVRTDPVASRLVSRGTRINLFIGAPALRLSSANASG